MEDRMIVNRENAPHYNWVEGCDGCALSPDPALNVIEERMPPHTTEIRYHRTEARQFFFVLAGELCMKMES